jgi:GAF domain-containing protein
MARLITTTDERDFSVVDLEESVPTPQSTGSSRPDAPRVVRDSVLGVRQAFEACLQGEGLTAALGMLNQRTRFRFTGLYRMEPPKLRNVVLYDRENPAVSLSGAVCALTDTFCSIVRERGRPLRVSDALGEPRLQDHPARESVQSYAGVPVRLPGGQVLGTLCHFDGRPRIMPASEIAILQEVAPLLVTWVANDSRA